MPQPFCSPCCSAGCTFCLDGIAPDDFEVLLAGVVDKAPEPDTPCANCATTNDTYLLSYDGAFPTYCQWSYTVDPFDDPLPCFYSLTLRIAKETVFSFTGDADHYYLAIQIVIGFDNATILFVADLGTDIPDCLAFDAEPVAYDSQDSVTGVGEWYCDYTGASFSVTALGAGPDPDGGFDLGFDPGFGA